MLISAFTLPPCLLMLLERVMPFPRRDEPGASAFNTDARAGRSPRAHAMAGRRALPVN